MDMASEDGMNIGEEHDHSPGVQCSGVIWYYNALPTMPKVFQTTMHVAMHAAMYLQMNLQINLQMNLQMTMQTSLPSS